MRVGLTGIDACGACAFINMDKQEGFVQKNGFRVVWNFDCGCFLLGWLVGACEWVPGFVSWECGGLIIQCQMGVTLMSLSHYHSWEVVSADC